MFSSSPAHAAPQYCALDAGFDVTNFPRFSSSGDTRLDRALIAELRKVNRSFPVRPGYAHIGAPNAFAHSVTYRAGTTGSIYFGLDLIRSELGHSFGGAVVAGIAAHEGAHSPVSGFTVIPPVRMQGRTEQRVPDRPNDTVDLNPKEEDCLDGLGNCPGAFSRY